jgi:hypothetical protein
VTSVTWSLGPLPALNATEGRLLSIHCDFLCGSDNLIPEPPNTAYSCGQHGPVTAWFWSARPGNVIPVPKTCFVGSRSTLFRATELLPLNFVFYYIYIFVKKIYLLQRNWRVLRVTRRCFWNAEQMFAAACAVLPPWPTCHIDQALEGIKLSDEDSTLKCSTPLSTCAQDLLDHSVPSSTKIWSTFEIWISNKRPQGQSWEINKCSLSSAVSRVPYSSVTFAHQFTRFVWVWNLVAHVEGRT